MLDKKKEKNIYIASPIIQKQTPIEEFFSQLKHYVRLESPQTYNEICKSIKNYIKNKIKKEHYKNYIKHMYNLYKYC